MNPDFVPVVHPMIDALEPRLLLAAVDPYNMGKGDWVWNLASARSNTGTATNLALFQYLKNKGMTWVIVKASDGTSSTYGNTQFNAQLVADAHNAGLKIFAYQYVYGANPTGEANAAKAVIARSTGIDGLVIDAEGEYERLANNAAAATTYLQSITTAYPDLFLAHAPFPIVSYHSAFPYYTFGKYVDVVMPQDYWGAIKITPTRMNQWRNDEWNALYNNWRNTGKSDGIKPIVPIAQGWNDSTTNTTTGAQIVEFIDLLKNTANPASPGGYKGVSFWSVQHHTADMWNGIGQATIGNPAYAPGDTIRVSGTGTSGLKAWSNSASAAPATYVVKPENAVGTIVSGPVFAQGYNRWEIRWKGETTTRWSAEDFLTPAAAPAAPTYAAPGNGVTYTTPPASLAWNDVDVATSYDVYLDGVLKANQPATTFSLANLPAGAHTWQVRARNSEGTTAGATWSFTYYVPSPTTPSFPSPGNLASLPTRPTLLNWNDSPNTTSYDVYLNNVLQANVTASQWALPPATAIAPKIAQTWRIVAKGPGGNVSGPNWFFTVNPITGDANADGTVNNADFKILYAHFGQPGTWADGDFDANNKVDFTDFQLLESHFGQTAPTPAAATLEEVLADADATTNAPPPVFSTRRVTPSYRPPAAR